MNPPEDPSLLTWFVDHWWAPLAGTVVGAWKFNKLAHSETRKVAADALRTHHEEDEKRFKALGDEQQTHRNHIAKLFDQMRDEMQRSESRHRELMTSVHDGHTQLLMALNSKADK